MLCEKVRKYLKNYVIIFKNSFNYYFCKYAEQYMRDLKIVVSDEVISGMFFHILQTQGNINICDFLVEVVVIW